MKHIVFLVLVIILTCSSARATGYTPSLTGVRSSSMGSLYSGANANAETLWLNPAVISKMDSRYNLTAGINVSQTYTKFQNTAPSLYQATTDNSLLLPWYIFFTASLSDKLSIGFSYNTPFVSLIKWQEENWTGRFLVRESENLITVLQPAVSYAITDYLYLGVGLMIARADMHFSKALPFGDYNQEGSVEISGNDWQYGINAGLFFLPTENIELGLNYKSGFSFMFENAGTVFSVPISLLSYFPENITSNSQVAIPAMTDLTASYQFSENTFLSTGVALIFKNNSESNSYTFNHTSSYLSHINIPEKRSYGVIARVGAEYDFADFLSFRAGISYQSATTDNEFFFPGQPDLNRLTFSAGGTLTAAPGLSFDAGLVYSRGLEKSAHYAPANFGGKYKSSCFTPGIGLSYVF